MTEVYRKALDKLDAGKDYFDKELVEDLEHQSPRRFGIGTWRFRQSKDSI